MTSTKTFRTARRLSDGYTVRVEDAPLPDGWAWDDERDFDGRLIAGLPSDELRRRLAVVADDPHPTGRRFRRIYDRILAERREVGR